MKRFILFLLMGGLLSLALIAAPTKPANGVWTNPDDSTLPVDFKIQGEYANDDFGAQVIALSNGKFQAVIYPGGLPGAGWDGKNKSLMDGTLKGQTATFTATTGNRRYLANNPAQFSATSKFPPQGQKKYSGSSNGKELTLKTDAGPVELKKVERESKTMGMKPLKGAVILFDGSNKDEWKGGRLDEKTKLLNTDGKDILTKRRFNNYTMHLEFLLPYKPAGRGQGRGNSGFYQVDHYEVQILDSFGLEGLDNECGGVYKKKSSDVNACFPPLTWQTYDVDFTNAIVKGDKVVKPATMTVKLNGIVIHDNIEINGKTGGSRNEAVGTPGPIKLQGHGNPLQFRNVWILEKN